MVGDSGKLDLALEIMVTMATTGQNVNTGGAGAIGHRVPYSEELAAQIRDLKNDSAKQNTPKMAQIGTGQGRPSVMPRCLKQGKVLS